VTQSNPIAPQFEFRVLESLKRSGRNPTGQNPSAPTLPNPIGIPGPVNPARSRRLGLELNLPADGTTPVRPIPFTRFLWTRRIQSQFRFLPNPPSGNRLRTGRTVLIQVVPSPSNQSRPDLRPTTFNPVPTVFHPTRFRSHALRAGSNPVPSGSHSSRPQFRPNLSRPPGPTAVCRMEAHASTRGKMPRQARSTPCALRLSARMPAAQCKPPASILSPVIDGPSPRLENFAQTVALVPHVSCPVPRMPRRPASPPFPVAVRSRQVW
jgi:hypothetical protein